MLNNGSFRAALGGVLLALTALRLASSTAVHRGASSTRSLSQYAPVCEAYLITGECVNEDGMEVEGSYRTFDEPCKWTFNLAEAADDLVGCIQDSAARAQQQGKVPKFICKALKLTGPKGLLLCAALCNTLYWHPACEGRTADQT